MVSFLQEYCIKVRTSRKNKVKGDLMPNISAKLPGVRPDGKGKRHDLFKKPHELKLFFPEFRLFLPAEQGEVFLSKLIGKAYPEATHVAPAVRFLVKFFCIVDTAELERIEYIIDVEGERGLFVLQKVFPEGEIGTILR